MADDEEVEEGEEGEEGEGDEGEGGTEDAEAGEEEEDETETIKRVMIKPGKSLTEPRDENLVSRLPQLPLEPKSYIPMAYTFRVPMASMPTKVTRLHAKCPPFYLLLDHAIAVIWMVFGTGEFSGPGGINQLQWALAFLKTVRNRTGDYTKDIEICIEAMENILMLLYADLNEDITLVERLDQNANYGGGGIGSGAMIIQEVPFSVNYSEMVVKCPPKGPQIGGTQPVSMSSLECEQELEKIKKAAGVDSIENLESAAREKALNVLKIWKSDQVQKIKGELRRLRSIEDKLKDIDTEFEGYTEDQPDELMGGN